MTRNNQIDAWLDQGPTSTGLFAGSIDEHAQLVADFMALGTPAFQGDAALQERLSVTASRLTEMLRWDHRYEEAIALQTALLPYLPDDAASLRIAACTFRIEAGDKEAGFRELHDVADHDPEGVWGWITLGTSYLWIGQYASAEEYLQRAANLDTADPCDHATAYEYLFRLYGLQRRVDEAVSAWEEAARLDPAFEATVPELLRMLIYWYYYELAERYVPREQCELRRVFYRDLINVKRSPVSPRGVWEWVMSYDPRVLEEAHDEFAEACLRFVKPRRALEAIEPLLDRGDFSRRRLVLAGLAWAQQRMLDRAMWALDLAVRVGDTERPRGTRRSVGGRRILDTESRILYGDIIIDPDVREEVDRYFMPVVDND